MQPARWGLGDDADTNGGVHGGHGGGVAKAGGARGRVAAACRSDNGARRL